MGGCLDLLSRRWQGPGCDHRKGWLGQSVGKITGHQGSEDQGVGWPSTCIIETQQSVTVSQEQKASMSDQKTNRQQSLSRTTDERLGFEQESKRNVLEAAMASTDDTSPAQILQVGRCKRRKGPHRRGHQARH